MMIRSHASFLAALMTSETTSPFLTSSSQGISFWKLSQNCFNFVHAPIFYPSSDSDSISWLSSESKLSWTQMSLIIALLSWARRIPYLMEIRLWSEQSVGIRMSFNPEINAFKTPLLMGWTASFWVFEISKLVDSIIVMKNKGVLYVNLRSSILRTWWTSPRGIETQKKQFGSNYCISNKNPIRKPTDKIRWC